MKASNTTTLECRNHKAEYVFDYVCTYSTSGSDSVVLGVGIFVALMLVIGVIWVKHDRQIRAKLDTLRREYRMKTRRQETGWVKRNKPRINSLFESHSSQLLDHLSCPTIGTQLRRKTRARESTRKRNMRNQSNSSIPTSPSPFSEEHGTWYCRGRRRTFYQWRPLLL